MKCANWKHRPTLAVLPPESFVPAVFLYGLQVKMKGSEAVMRCRIRAPTGRINPADN